MLITIDRWETPILKLTVMRRHGSKKNQQQQQQKEDIQEGSLAQTHTIPFYWHEPKLQFGCSGLSS